MIRTLIFIFLIIGCISSNHKDEQNLKNNDTIISNTFNKGIFDTAYLHFLTEFDRRELPYGMMLESRDWMDLSINEPKTIPDSLIIKYFPTNFNRKLNKFIGYKYYYGFSILLNKDLIAVIYFRATDIYTGYILSVLDKNGNFKDDILFSVTKGEFDIEAQKEGIIKNKEQIEITEIILDKFYTSDELFEATATTMFYRITDEGKIVNTDINGNVYKQ